MKQKRFNVEQIVAVLKQAEAGVPLAELQGSPVESRDIPISRSQRSADRSSDAHP